MEWNEFRSTGRAMMDGQDLTAAPQEAEAAPSPEEISYEDAFAAPTAKPQSPQVPLEGTPVRQISYDDAAFAGRPDAQRSVLGQILGTDSIDKFQAGMSTLGYNILHAYGDLAHQTADDFKQELTDSNGGEFVESLRKTGIFDPHAQDQSDFHNAYLLKQAVPATENLLTGLAGTFNEDIARAAAGTGTAAQSLFGALSIPFTETGKAAGLSDEEQGALMMLLHVANVPSVALPRPVAEAHAKGIIGTTEAQNAGLEPLTEAQHITQTVAEAQVNPPPAAATTPLDANAIARNLAPETFAQYDPLLARQETLRGQLADLQAARTAPLDEQIKAIQEAKQGGYGKLQALMAKRDAVIAEGDTPEMAAVRQQMLENDYKMRDLAPHVSDAYRQAAAFAPQELASEAGPEAQKLSEEGQPAAKPIEEQRQAIISDFTERAKAAGVSDELANAHAELEAARYQTLAEQYPKFSAEEWYNRESAELKQAQPKGIRELAQDELGQFETPEHEAYARKIGQLSNLEAQIANETDHSKLTDLSREKDLVQKWLDEHQQELNQSNRGAFKFATDNTKSTIKLFKNADASTLIHEKGHEWTNQILRLAKDDDAPAQLKADAETIRNYAGAEDGIISRKGHEKLARAFERYMMQGTAPSPQLASVFAKFMQWMKNIYQSVKSMNKSISPDIQDVFDRFFAKEPQRTVIAPDHEPGDLLAGIHERDAAETPIEKAPQVADTIRSEIKSTAQQHEAREAQDVIQSAETGGGAANREGIQPTTANAAPQEPVAVGERGTAPAAKGAYERVPRKPLSLIDWIKKQGGLQDEGGEVSAIMGGKKGGLIRKNGQTLDDLALAAQEAGYFTGNERPDINGLLEKIREDQAGNRQYSIHDAQAVESYKGALARNAETDRLVDQFGIDTKGKTSAQIYDEIANHMSQEQRAHESQSLMESQEKDMADAEKAARDWFKSRGESWEPDAFYGKSTTATLEDLENAREQERLAAQPGEGAGGAGIPGLAAGDQGQIQGGGGQGGRGLELAGREPGKPDGTAGLARSHAAAEAARGATREPAAPNPKVPNDAFGERKSGFIDKAGNLRPELITSDQDVRNALHEYADQHPELVTHEVITDQQVADMADAMGVDARTLNVDKLRDLSVNDGIPLAVRVRGGMKMLVDNLQATIDLMGQSPTDENAIKYLDAKERAVMMMETMSGVSNEMGRAFRAFNNFYKDYNMKNVDEIKELFQRMTARTIDDVKAEMQKGALLKSPLELAKFLQKSYQPDFLDRIIEYRNDCLLSGPVTHSYYTTGNYTTAFIRPLQTLAAVGSQTLEEAFGKEINQRIYAREALAQWNAITYGSWRGLQAAAKSWRENAEVAVPTEIAARGAKAIAAQNAPVIPGLGQELTWMTRQSALATGGLLSRTAGKLMSPVGRSISALHSLQKVVFYEQGKAALAVREAMDKGLQPGSDDYTKLVTDRINNPTTEIMNKAGQEAIKFAGREKTDYNSLGGKAMNMVNSNRALKLIFPFMKMDYNFEMLAYRDNSLLGLLSDKTRADLSGANGDVARNMVKGRMAVGTALLGSGVGMAALGINNGSGPSDPKAWKTWRLTHTPYSLQIGSLTIPHKALGPIFGKFLGMSANLYEGVHQFSTDDMTKSSVQFIDKIGDALFQSTLVKQAGDAAEAAFTGGQKATRFIQNFATSFLPYDVGAGQINRAFNDPYSRRVKSFGFENAFGIPEAMMYQYPGASDLLEPNYDMFGRPITNSSSYDQYANDPVHQKLESLQTGIGRLSDKIKGVQLDEEQYSEFSRLAGQMSYARLARMIAQPSFDKLPPQHQLTMIEHAVTASRHMAASTVMKKYPQIKADAVAKKRTAMFGNPAVNGAEDEKYEDVNNP